MRFRFMTTFQAFQLFEDMIQLATNELISFSHGNNIAVKHKVDKSVVTACDRAIDIKLTQTAQKLGFSVISEEGHHQQAIVSNGNYLTIDPIDGSLGYIDYINYALQNGGISQFLQKDLGPESDFCLLLGIVKNGKPKYGACYNYITKEKILLDASKPEAYIRENNKRKYITKNAIYIDP